MVVGFSVCGECFFALWCRVSRLVVAQFASNGRLKFVVVGFSVCGECFFALWCRVSRLSVAQFASNGRLKASQLGAIDLFGVSQWHGLAGVCRAGSRDLDDFRCRFFAFDAGLGRGLSCHVASV